MAIFAGKSGSEILEVENFKTRYVYEYGWQCCNCMKQGGTPKFNVFCALCPHILCRDCPWEKIKIRASDSSTELLVDGKLSTPRQNLCTILPLDTGNEKASCNEKARNKKSCKSAKSNQDDHSRDLNDLEITGTKDRVLQTKVPLNDAKSLGTHENLLRIFESAIRCLLGDSFNSATHIIHKLRLEIGLDLIANGRSHIMEDGKGTNPSESSQCSSSDLTWNEPDSTDYTTNTTAESLGSSAGQGSGSRASKSVKQTSSGNSNARRSSQKSQKRDHSPDDPEDPKKTSASKRTQQIRHGRLYDFACHFHKRDPERYLTDPDLKYRACVKARIPRDQMSRMNDHYSSVHLDELGPEKFKQIKTILAVRKRVSGEDKWHKIWELLFPGAERQESPYNEPLFVSPPDIEKFRSTLNRLLEELAPENMLQLNSQLRDDCMRLACQAFEESKAGRESVAQPTQIQGENETRLPGSKTQNEETSMLHAESVSVSTPHGVGLLTQQSQLRVPMAPQREEAVPPRPFDHPMPEEGMGQSTFTTLDVPFDQQPYNENLISNIVIPRATQNSQAFSAGYNTTTHNDPGAYNTSGLNNNPFLGFTFDLSSEGYDMSQVTNLDAIPRIDYDAATYYNYHGMEASQPHPQLQPQPEMQIHEHLPYAHLIQDPAQSQVGLEGPQMGGELGFAEILAVEEVAIPMERKRERGRGESKYMGDGEG